MTLAIFSSTSTESKPPQPKAQTQQVQKCVVCGGVLNAVGVCLSCDTYTSVLSDGRASRTIMFPLDAQEKAELGRMPIGNATTAKERPLRLVIDGHVLFTPSISEMILGRCSDRNTTGKQQADIDLQAFNGESKGVSRLHARLTRRDNMVFVTDLNSTNGTRLNDRRLVGGSERLVRDGDVLQLGSLRIVVNFKP